MNLDNLIAELQAIRTSPDRGRLPVTAEAPGMEDMRPIRDVRYIDFQYGEDERVSLTVDDSEGS